MFKKLLIANRGEIACRIIRTARRMGIATVAIHSEADRQALHVEMADEAVCVGGAASADSYLNVKAILAAIRATGADALHPGYGFLSENAAFARSLKRAGVTFIGPPPKAITAMGDKIESKRLAARAGVSIVPGHDGAVADARAAIKAARDIGYPVMLKASAGGGGKGMRIAYDDDGVREGLASAAREAKASFGDDRILVEKFIEQPRHIEIQVLADAHGTCLYLGERECSLQRRHQKVIEEAPSPFLDAATRRAMGEQAVALARAVGYTSAGTVEFIVDASRNFYFLEMNTRLQVEHPVTECVTGLDLVEQMIRIAAGEKLSLSQDDVTLSGWSIEARLYAEDPARGFLPSVGRLVRYAPPPESEGLRIDSGVKEGGEISVFYDPMIAKVVTHGADRGQAIRRMARALDGFVIEGLACNLGFLSSLMNHPRFAEARLSTAFIAEEYPDGFDGEKASPIQPEHVAAIAAVAHVTEEFRGAAGGAGEWVVLESRQRHALTLAAAPGGWDISIGGGAIAVRTDWRPGQPVMAAEVAGEPMVFRIRREGASWRVVQAGVETAVQVLRPRLADLARRMPPRRIVDRSHLLLSPMPGHLVSIAVAPGQEVRAGEALAVVEAMKMENVLRATRDGRVAKLHAGPGDILSVDQVILEFETHETAR